MAGATPGAWSVDLVGDSLVVATLGDRMDEATNLRAHDVARRLRERRPAGVRDVVESYTAVSLHVDPARADTEAIREVVREVVATTPPPDVAALTVHAAVVTVPVRYGGDDGPDLEEVARMCRLTPDEVVRRHADRVYRVYMLGFLAGFAYLGRIDPALVLPRRDRPRLQVPAGSVGIAGEQTGIYPVEAPGGWRLIGRTALRPFDASRRRPSLFRPGDRVRFVDERAS